MPCSICGEPGHNKKSCLLYKTLLAEAEEEERESLLTTYYTHAVNFGMNHPFLSCILQPAPALCQLFKDRTSNLCSTCNELPRNGGLVPDESVTEPHAEHHDSL